MSEIIEKKLPQKKISIVIDENSYDIDYPKNGQFIQIESLKMALTRGSYNSFSESTNTSTLYARYTVDMIAFFSTCCPKLREDLKVETFADLDMLSTKKLMKVYVNTILPWLMEWEVILNADD